MQLSWWVLRRERPRAAHVLRNGRASSRGRPAERDRETQTTRLSRSLPHKSSNPPAVLLTPFNGSPGGNPWPSRSHGTRLGGVRTPILNVVEPMILTKWHVEAGSPHDPNCYECSLPGHVEPCDTCRLSWHEACKPSGSSLSTRDGAPHWHCAICVNRGWHTTPPMITPPASPPLSPRRAEMAPVDELRPAGNSSAQAQHSRNDTSGNSTQHATPHLKPPTLPPSENEPSGGVNKSQKRSTPKPSTSNVTRKSRYNTLPAEVDSALMVVYRELESVPLLQRNIADHEAEIARLRQTLTMQTNELAMMRRSMEKSRKAEAELERLKAESANRQAATHETEALKAKNQQLESELAKVHDELGKANETLQGWKHKLSNMLGDR